jgi:hypothetical protein
LREKPQPPVKAAAVVDKAPLFSFVMAGLVPAICEPLIWLDPQHKAEDDDGKAGGV